MEAWFITILISSCIIIVVLVALLMWYVYRKNKDISRKEEDKRMMETHNEALIDSLHKKDRFIRTLKERD